MKTPVRINVRGWAQEDGDRDYLRFRTSDGAILDWWHKRNGRLDVRGKASSLSYQHLAALVSSVDNSILPAGADEQQWQRSLNLLLQLLDKHIPPSQETLEPVGGIGWRVQETQNGLRFDFTDGAVVHYYRTTATLQIQGKGSEMTRNVLNRLPSPFWAGEEELRRLLEQLFPDWRIGSAASDPVVQTSISQAAVLPVTARFKQPMTENRKDPVMWRAFWPEDRLLRTTPNRQDPCQEAFLQDWSDVLSDSARKALVAHAPTGMGKTSASLVPALAWVAQSQTQRHVFFLVNRITQHENVLKELRERLAPIFQARTGTSLRVVDLIGQTELCIHPGSRPLDESCRKSKENASFNDLPSPVASWTEVKAHLEGSRRCPYHTLQGLMRSAHVVVCDYWWLFSEYASQGKLLHLTGLGEAESIVIVDEAHNLPLRVRKELDIERGTDDLEADCQTSGEKVQSALLPVILRLKAEAPELPVPNGELRELAGGEANLQKMLCLLGDEDAEPGISTPERLVRLLLLPDDDAVFYRQEDERGNTVIARRIDPIPVLTAGFDTVRAALLMSATLAAPTDPPGELEYQIPLFGLHRETTSAQRYASPFPRENQRWLYVPDTYGTFSRRPQYLATYAKHIVSISRNTPGASAAFFSSYEFLRSVKEALLRMFPDEKALIMEEDAGGLASLAWFENELRGRVAEHGRAILLGVYQGRIAEGADFSGNLIRSITCVSLPLEFPGLFHERLEAKYQSLFQPIAAAKNEDAGKKSKEYAKRRLCLSLVLQACGRGIRQMEDCCAFVLLDRRYGPMNGGVNWRDYLLPTPFNVSSPGERVGSFFTAQQTTEEVGTWDPYLVSFCRRIDQEETA